MSVYKTVDALVQNLWSLPTLVLIFSLAVYVTVQLGFVQFRYLFESVRLAFAPAEAEQGNQKSDELSSFQAFVNTLGANIGNGSLAGIAVAIYAGGPGAIVWLLILATFSAALRFAEVVLGTHVISQGNVGRSQGGPMVYMSYLPGGIVWSYVFTFFALGFMFAAGNLAQGHAVGLAVRTALGIKEFTTAFFVLAFIVYVFVGGSQRIVALLDKLVPFKVGLFLVTASMILIYHYQNIPYALYLMLYSAWQPHALFGGAVGFSLQQAISIGFQQGVFASEAGLGTAAIAFSTTKGKSPVRCGILAMLGVFINLHLICFLVALCLIVSGAWQGGQTSSAMVVAAYETVFGTVGGWIVLLLVVNFAMSVLVAGAYNGKRCWDFLFSGKYSYMFPFLYSIAAFCGTWMNVDLVWDINSLVNGFLLLSNLAGLLWSLRIVKKQLKLYQAKRV